MSTKAKESKQVERVREKLKKQLSIADKKVTQAALEKTRSDIAAWIQRHASERLTLKSKSLSLFDENKHPALSKSPYVKHLAHFLKTATSSKKGKSLKGRISHL